MSKKNQTASQKPSQAVAPTITLTACLGAPTAYSDRSVIVDPAGGVIKNVSLMSVGPARGHGFDIDATTLQQLVSLAAVIPDGVKSRFKHPAMTSEPDGRGGIVQSLADDTGTQVGRILNVRLDGDCVRGDIHLGAYASKIPGLGDVRNYLILHAQEDPAGIGMSAMFDYTIDPVIDDAGRVTSAPARLCSLAAIDFVGTPAANPNGLLSAKPETVPPAPSPADRLHDVRDRYLAALVQEGPMSLAALAAKFSGRIYDIRATADLLVAQGRAVKIDGRIPIYKPTESGAARMASLGIRIRIPTAAS